MIYRETENVFHAFVKKYGEHLTANSSDVLVAPHIPADAVSSVRANFCISSKDTVLYVRDTSFQNERNQGIVVTDRGLYHLSDSSARGEVFFLPWYKISQVVFQSNAFLFYLYGNDAPYVIEGNCVLKENYREWVNDIQAGADRVKSSADELLRGAVCWKESFDKAFYEDSFGMDRLRSYKDILRNSFALGNTLSLTVGGVLDIFSSRKAQKKERGNLVGELFNGLAATQRAEYTDYFDETYDRPTEGVYNRHCLPV